jgi:hypothetical protein
MTEVIRSRTARPGVLIKLRYLRQFSMLTGRRLALTLAFTVLVALATGISCRGFFQPNTLETVTLQPPSLDIGIGSTQQFTAAGRRLPAGSCGPPAIQWTYRLPPRDF